jgi:mono/diheme cytochrome c family protein
VRLIKIMGLNKEKTNFNMFLNISVKRWSLAILLLFISSTLLFAQDGKKPEIEGDIALGENLFKQNCTACHAINEVLVGPALKGISKRKKMDWIIDFVHNSQKVIKSGDPYSVALYEKFNKTEMPPFPQFSADDIKSMIAFVENAAEAAPEKGSEQAQATGESQQSGGEYSTLILSLIIVVLVLVLLMLVVFLSVIRKYLKDKESGLSESDKYLVNQKIDFGVFFKSRGFITVVILIFLAVGVRSCWTGLLSVGVDQNYAPKQPIPFSHKQHVGEYDIDCGYCHTGVYKGKQAGIPSVNICMNCHNSIKSGPRFGEEAIKQVVTAWETNSPIKWVRVHNLPDLAYFNHSQHTVVGNIPCETCHGPIGEMEVVKQFSPLTMGWCISCHRETAVNGKDNEYYDRLYAAHDGKSITVAEMGGLECSKCHY